MKITNLRPKEGASVILDKDGHAVLFDSDGHVVVTLAERFDMEHLDYDVQPEYKEGDLLAIECPGFFDGIRRGFVQQVSSDRLFVAVAGGWDFKFDKESLKEVDLAAAKIVGLWLEGEENN